jgi:hypothetical protein
MTSCVVYCALFAALALASDAPAAPPETRSEIAVVDFQPAEFQPGDGFLDYSAHDMAEPATARVVFVTGVVDAIEKDFFGRPERVAIVSVGEQGVLLQNAVEDMSAGHELKDHVGEGVTARGVVMVKADGSMSLLVDAFQVHGDEGGFVAGDLENEE